MALEKLGERLVEAGLVTAEAIDQALAHQKITGHRLGDCLVELGLVGESSLLRFLAGELKTRFVSTEKLAKAKIPSEVMDRVPVRMAEAQVFLPLAMDDERQILSIVTTEPQNTDLLKEIALITEMREVFAYVGLRSAILAGIRKHYYGDNTAFAALEQGGPGALKADISAVANAYEATGGQDARPPTAVRLMVDTGKQTRASRSGGTSIRLGATQLREALSARGAIGDADYIETLNVLVGLLESPQEHMRGHSAQLSRQAATLARRMGLQPREVAQVSIAAYLHDLGKRPDRHFTLASNDANPEWKAEAKRLVRSPIKLFETVHLPVAVNAILAQIYEAHDGSGTPQGAAGEEIAPGARILAVVDGYLDLTKNPGNALGRLLGKDEAIAFMTERSGKLYDPVVIDLLGRLLSGELLRQRVDCEGRQVLVADPDEATRTDLHDALSKGGLLVHGINKLEGTIDALLAGEADLVAVGLRFGLPDVIALVQLIRGRPESAGLPVVVLGEPPDAPGRESLLQAGPSDVIPMPFDPEEAAKRIQNLFRDHVAHGGPGHLVHGSFDELSPGSLMGILGHGRKSGRLLVRNGSQDGVLHFERGRAVFAVFGGKTGEPAVQSMLDLEQAEFTYDPEAILLDIPHMDKDLEAVVRQR
ncbi:MAG: DUF4388 domain-containing protein [Myxococcales bacterium]|nr:DUF4388 domain-containing protein [Myxococcales bacterium]